MRLKLPALILCVCLAPSILARGQAEADGCGDDKAKFDVKSEKTHAEPAAPAAGQAQIVFIETLGECGGCSSPSMRFGGDGDWPGANKGNSYFAVNTAQGNHRVCASWQGNFGDTKQVPRWIDFAAVAGHVYYFEANVAVTSRLTGVGLDASTELTGVMTFSRVSDDEGRRLVKAYALSVSKPRK